MTSTAKRILAGIVIAAAIIVATVIFWPSKDETANPPSDNGGNIKAISGTPRNGGGDNGGNGGGQISPATQKDPQKHAKAIENYKKGMALIEEGKIVQGRIPLSAALLSGDLDAAQGETAREKLAELADEIILLKKIYDGDPYAEQYFMQAGETLAGKNGVERRKKLHVPTSFIMRINGISDACKIRAGQAIKLIKGPFHAIIDKSNFTMDVYLHRKGLPKIYVKRFPVGIGKNGTTPAGMWKVELGSKMKYAPWNPPPGSGHTRAIEWGQKDYPLGKMGYWIGLKGIDDATRNHTGYGIHGTDEPDSIGKAQSLGCIRLADDDIELVFAMLYEEWSTILIRK